MYFKYIEKRNRDVLLAYIVGFFDGEGTVGIIRQKTGKHQSSRREFKHVVNVSVTQVELEPLLIFKSLFGGHINKFYEKHTLVFRWRASSNIANDFLLEIKKYSITKKEEIEKALTFNSLISKNYRPITDENYNKRNEIYFALREMKKIKYSKQSRNLSLNKLISLN